MAFTRASGKKLHLGKEGCNYQDSAMPFILGSESSFTMLSTYQLKKSFLVFGLHTAGRGVFGIGSRFRVEWRTAGEV